MGATSLLLRGYDARRVVFRDTVGPMIGEGQYLAAVSCRPEANQREQIALLRHYPIRSGQPTRRSTVAPARGLDVDWHSP
jgi:hypothetical protein